MTETRPDRRRSRSPDRRQSRSPDRRDKDRRSRSPHRRPRSPERARSRSPRRDRRSRSRSPRREPRDSRRSPRRARSRSRSRSVSRSRRRSRSRDRYRRSRSRSSSSSSSDSDGSRDRRKRRKRHDKEERRREKKARKKEKRERKEKKHKGKSSAVTGQWGQYGIINESQMYEKDAEFRTWLVEERKINPESLSKEATKKHFAQFVEDYNTATLPHPKFYNIESYERQMNSLRNGMTADITTASYDPSADMAAHSSRHKRPAAEPETHLTREQLMELRKVQNERVEAGKMKLLGMDIKGNFGVRMDTTYE